MPPVTEFTEFTKWRARSGPTGDSAGRSGLRRTVIQALDESDRVGVDLETTGLDPSTDRARLMTLATDRGVYIVDLFKVAPTPLFEALAEKTLIGHNFQF